MTSAAWPILTLRGTATASMAPRRTAPRSAASSLLIDSAAHSWSDADIGLSLMALRLSILSQGKEHYTFQELAYVLHCE